jgi:hypothetical protein
LDDFLPMPSLSMTSSAHWMWRSSAGSARSRRAPEGKRRRRVGVWTIVLPAEEPVFWVAAMELAMRKTRL